MDANNADRLAARLTVSVCVPTYNNSATIERCLRSILDQDGVDFEILVIDDDSADDSAAIAATMLRPDDRLIRNDARLGLCGNHNKCIELASGRLVQFVHGDDWLLPEALQRLARCFDTPTVGLAFAPRRIMQDHVPRTQRLLTKPHELFWRLGDRNEGKSLVAEPTLVGGGVNLIGEPTSVMFRRELALAAGGLREDIYQLVDLDFWLRLMLRSEVCFIPSQLAVRVQSLDTESVRNARTGRSWLDQLRILTWLIADPAATRTIRMCAAVWWPLVWLALNFQAAAFGPQRWSRLKTLAKAPVREFEIARQRVAQLERGKDLNTGSR